MSNYNIQTTIFITAEVVIDEDQALKEDIKFYCHAWDNGDEDPQGNDSGFYVNHDRYQELPKWVTHEVINLAGAQAEKKFAKYISENNYESPDNSDERYELSRESA